MGSGWGLGEGVLQGGSVREKNITSSGIEHFERQLHSAIITKGVFSLEEPLESQKSLESLKNGRILLCFPQSRDSLESLESLKSLESLENGLF